MVCCPRSGEGEEALVGENGRSPLSTCSAALPVHLPVGARGWHPRHLKAREESERTAGGCGIDTFSGSVLALPADLEPTPTPLRNKRVSARLSVADLGISKMIKACEGYS